MDRERGYIMTALQEKIITDSNKRNQKLIDWQKKRLAELCNPEICNKPEFKEDIKQRFVEIGIIDKNGNLTPQYGGEGN